MTPQPDAPSVFDPHAGDDCQRCGDDRYMHRDGGCYSSIDNDHYCLCRGFVEPAKPVTTEREPGPVWASFEAWAAYMRERFHIGRFWLRAEDAWEARQPEIEALKAENQALTKDRDDWKATAEALGDQPFLAALGRDNQALRARLAEMEAADPFKPMSAADFIAEMDDV